MTLGELINLARIYTDDTVVPYAVSDAEHTVFANRAEREACERGGLLFDVIHVTLAAGQTQLQLDAEILAIVYVKADDRELGKMIPTDMDGYMPAAPRDGAPMLYAQREQFLVFDAAPLVDTGITIKLYRYPSKAMEVVDDEPEIAPYHQEYLAHWMAYQGFTRFDPDYDSKPIARDHLALFERRFGRPRSALEIRSWREFPRNTHVKMRMP